MYKDWKAWWIVAQSFFLKYKKVGLLAKYKKKNEVGSRL